MFVFVATYLLLNSKFGFLFPLGSTPGLSVDKERVVWMSVPAVPSPQTQLSQKTDRLSLGFPSYL